MAIIRQVIILLSFVYVEGGWPYQKYHPTTRENGNPHLSAKGHPYRAILPIHAYSAWPGGGGGTF